MSGPRRRRLNDSPTAALVAIVGGSGAGKTWLANELQCRLGKGVSVLSLDNFYRDRSHLSYARRQRLNFDHPRAIDWGLFETVLRECQTGRPAEVPRYDFTQHARTGMDVWRPKRVVLVEGLWLLRRPKIRRLFALSIFVECSAAVQLARRIARDVTQRGRSEPDVRKQYHQTVLPMFERFVRHQAAWADVAVRSPVEKTQLSELIEAIESL